MAADPPAATDAGRDAAREAWLRRMSCCDSVPACATCPMVPENAGRSLKELAMAALLPQGPRGDSD